MTSHTITVCQSRLSCYRKCQNPLVLSLLTLNQ